MIRAASLVRWTPIRLYCQGNAPRVDWCDMGGWRFTDPFFDQTVERRLQHPFPLLFRPQTPVEVLAELAELNPGLRPKGFIFHVSRCGSTVISRMLAAPPQNIVVSEAGAIDSVLRARSGKKRITDEECIAWLRSMVSALGQRRHTEEQNFFIKFDGWQTIMLPLIRQAFPDVPCVFVYRDPVEVIVSHQRRAAHWMFQGNLDSEITGQETSAVLRMPKEEYFARMLGRICQAALENLQTESLLLVNHKQLPAAVTSSLLKFFGVSYEQAEIERMMLTAQFHAKEPSMNYFDDSEEKRVEASNVARQAAQEWVGKFYEELESKRLGAESEQ